MPQRNLNEFDEEFDIEIEEKFDPLSATFQGGKQEPFHGWYPYLEGYSPEFVETILYEYMSDVGSLIDPFAGTVTTGFAAAEYGLESYYCEVNPVMQFIADVKADVRTSSRDTREHLSNELRVLSNELQDRISNSKSDQTLISSYDRVFNGSEYFDENSFEEITAFKTLSVRLEKEDALLSSSFQVAVLASLVPCSKLKRAGDVRFMTEDELEDGIPKFQDEVSQRLRRMAEDLVHKNAEIDNKPLLLAENANNLHKIPDKQIEGLITSPPYINGTNYFRNTKLELWFMGCLTDENDLTKYREQALTSGINTVKGDYEVLDIELIQNVVADLEEHGYDRRLPLMVAGYTYELQNVFDTLQNHLVDGAKIAIDIGDSIFAGVHIPADQMIIELLSELGYEWMDTVKLRDRYSNDGSELKQVLLIFKYHE